MNKKVLTIFIVFFQLYYFFSPITIVKAFGHASDTISLSWPATPSNHTIKFLVTKDIPPAGHLEIKPPVGFFIPPGFSFADVDMATSSTINGIFGDRELASSSSAFSDGVSVVASSTNGSIVITLNSVNGITANTYIQIELGTNAEYGESGSEQIINATSTGSYKTTVYSYDNSGAYLERAIMMIAIIRPVTLGTYIAKLRSNGRPDGILGYGTAQTIMSLNTNYLASCRYSTTPNTLYTSMTEEFLNTGAYYHSQTISGLQNGHSYIYYVRCRDAHNVDDTTDYIIDFEVSGQEGEDGTDDTSGSPGSDGSGPGSGGGSGGGGGGGAGPAVGDNFPNPPLPSSPVVTFTGYAYPNSKVVLLQDGVEVQTVIAAADSTFTFDIYDLDKGVYTFGLWAEDELKRHSAVQSFTFWIDEGTKTEIYRVIIPPTIAIKDKYVDIGEVVDISGQSAKSATIESWLYPKKDGAVSDSEIIKKKGITDTVGFWSLLMDTNDLTSGIYRVKVHSSIDGEVFSNFSQSIDISVGGAELKSGCPGADLNKDGKVNITDFSILLYHWGTGDSCADQNADGTVNITDFSIMLYYWTG